MPRGPQKRVLTPRAPKKPLGDTEKEQKEAIALEVLDEKPEVKEFTTKKSNNKFLRTRRITWVLGNKKKK
jgi:hypothetical protein